MSRHAKQGRPDRDPEHAPVDLGRLRAELQAMQPNRRGGGYRFQPAAIGARPHKAEGGVA